MDFWERRRIRPPHTSKISNQHSAIGNDFSGTEKDGEYDSKATALEGKRELNAEETARLKQLEKKLVRMFHPDLHGGAHAPSRVVFSAHR